MKLKTVEIFAYDNPHPGFGGRYFTFVKVTTDTGLVGWGEAYAATVGPPAMIGVIEDVFERHFVGEDPANIERLYRKVYSSGFTQRPDLTVMGAFSALEMACWDIRGKALKEPVWKLLGGRIHKEIRAYTYLYPHDDEDAATFYNDPVRSAKRAKELVEIEGFTAIKFDPAGAYTMLGGHQPSLYDLERSREFCLRIREAVSTKADILFGTHGQFTTSGAIRMSEAIKESQPLWFEEPIPPDNLLEFAKVVAASPIPIASGERLVGKSEFATLLQSGGVSIVQPTLGRVGGIWEAKKIAIMAEAFNAQIAPHLYAGPIEWAANLHLATSCPNFLIAESILKGEGDYGALIGNVISFKDGYFVLPDKPGLGIEVNEDEIRSRPYTGSKLHLEMQSQPHDYRAPSRFAGG